VAVLNIVLLGCSWHSGRANAAQARWPKARAAPTLGGAAVIRLSGINKSYDRPVLRGVDLSVPAGCLYGLIGPGAAGKSVLLKIIAGLIRPDSGSVLVAERNVLAMTDLELQEFRKQFGMLFQNNALFDFMTVGDNIAFPLRRLFDLSDRDIEQRVAERLRCVSLPGFEQRLPSGLSGGQKKRVRWPAPLQAPIVL
jgi:phospholipid/cholesterol/gamma-HCH transport system ATP-binding protein